jgi:hypothetical protein
MFEVLALKRKSNQAEFHRGFQGMAAEPVTIEELTNATESLIEAVVRNMPEPHRRFLLSPCAWNILRFDKHSGSPQS